MVTEQLLEWKIKTALQNKYKTIQTVATFRVHRVPYKKSIKIDISLFIWTCTLQTLIK